MEQIALSLLAALALLILFRRPGTFAPVLVGAGQSRAGNTIAPGDEEEQLPETDRAKRPWLTWAVGAVAIVRVALLATLHA